MAPALVSVSERDAQRCASGGSAFHLLALGAAHPGNGVLVLPARGCAVLAAPSGARAADAAHAPRAVTLEPHARHGHPLLLATSGAEAALELNGLPAPPVAVLRPGDEIRIGSGAPLFVDYFREPPFVIAGAAHAESSCQLCRGPIVAGRRIYSCECGAVTHAESGGEGGQDAAEALDCAVGSCTGCNRRLVTEAGYVRGGGPDGP